MKKLISLFVTMTLIAAMAVPVAAEQTISFSEDGTATVTDSNQQVVQPEVKAEDASAQKNVTESALEALFGAPAADATNSNDVIGYLALGGNLTQDQLTTVLSLLGVAQADLGRYRVVYITNADEHASLDKYIDPSVIGTKSLSSVLVTPAEAGHGVVVTTQNINYCTTNMYRNALITAGVTDADIKVAAPTPISGTAALIGALKAYEQMSGKNVSDSALDTSLDELVTTGELSDSVADGKAEEIISYVKALVAANDLNTEEEMRAAIAQAEKDLNVQISDSDKDQIVKLMVKIKSMGIDFNVLMDQADDIYAKYKDQIDAGTFDISKVKVEDLGLGKIISNAVGNFFEGIGDAVSGFFGKLFGK